MDLIVCPLHDVAAAIQHWQPSHIVSLASPGAATADIKTGVERLSLTFHDIAEARPGLTACEPDDVAALLAFARGWTGASPMLVQCWAGVSRSPAAAYAVACAFAAPGQEAELAMRLRAAAPFATPNTRLVALADDILGRGGRMMNSVRAIGRGAEVSCGTTFRWRLSAPA